ncbi:hypothetical protein PG985_014133 [Apiospora marii]|uniref:uncharacterized protein n=1 Tax=Apiospora marii TaxID=335849 RepID=UPI00313104A7
MWSMEYGRFYPTDASKRLRLIEAAKDAQFMPFPRLPVELRCKVWRATWEPQVIWPNGLITSPRRDEMELRVGGITALPISARVNHESREETLRHYNRVPNSPVFVFRAYINPKIDEIHLNCSYKPLCPTMSRAHFDRLEHLTMTTRFENGPINDLANFRVPEYAFTNPSPDPEWVKHRTLGNFLFYVQNRYFPKLRTLTVIWRKYQLYLEEIPANWGDSLNAARLFRSKDNGRGLYVVPLFRGDTFGGFRVHFLKKNEVARYGDWEPAAKRSAWLEAVGVALWAIMRPESFLDEDGVTDYRTQQQHHQLL